MSTNPATHADSTDQEKWRIDIKNEESEPHEIVLSKVAKLIRACLASYIYGFICVENLVIMA